MTLRDGIDVYVQMKRANGLVFETGSKGLYGFCRHAGNLLLTEVTAKDVLTFLNGPRTSVVTFRGKHSLLRHFFEFWASRDAMPTLRMPPPPPPEYKTFVSYVYSRAEIRTIVRAIGQSQRHTNCTLDQQTLRTALLLLYGTGARVGEICRLSCQDIDLKRGFMTIRGGRFDRSRRIPIGHDLRQVISSYIAFRSRKLSSDSHLFLTKSGQAVTAETLRKSFQRLRQQAGISGKVDSVYEPRMHDLRCTFAVHRITAWIRSKADLNRMLPALSAYMGLAGLSATERFLLLTPERFRKELDKLSPKHGKKRWRNDPALMTFLAAL
jgi:integrase/recombinase XerD